MIVFSCKHCNHQIRVSENYAGKKGKCHNCHNIVEVPAKSEGASAAADAKIKFYCSKCSQKIGALKEWAGKMVKCPRCSEINKVPSEIPAQTVSEGIDKTDDGLPDNQDANALFEKSITDEILKMEQSGTELEEPIVLKAEEKSEPSRHIQTIDDYSHTQEEGADTGRPSRLRHNVPLAILCSFAGAIVGAVIWAIVGSLSGYELGIVAIGVGALAGVGITLFTQERTTGLGIIAALFAVIGILTGKFLVAKYVIVPEIERIIREGDSEIYTDSKNASFTPEEIKEMVNDEDAMLSVTLMYLAENKEFEKEVLKQYYIGTLAEEMPPNVQEQAGKIQARVSECLAGWDSNRKEQVVREMYPKVLQEFQNEIIDSAFFQTAMGIGAFIASFSLFDLLWFPLAIWTAFKIGSGRTEN